MQASIEDLAFGILDLSICIWEGGHQPGSKHVCVHHRGVLQIDFGGATPLGTMLANKIVYPYVLHPTKNRILRKPVHLSLSRTPPPPPPHRHLSLQNSSQNLVAGSRAFHVAWSCETRLPGSGLPERREGAPDGLYALSHFSAASLQTLLQGMDPNSAVVAPANLEVGGGMCVWGGG